MNELSSSLKQLEKRIFEVKHEQERQSKFKAAAKSQFKKNLDVLKSYYPSLYRQVESFKPRNDFEVFASPSGYGNFVPKSSKVPIYGDDPLQQCIEHVDRYTKDAYFARCNLIKKLSAGTKADHRLHTKIMVELSETFADIILDDEPMLKTLPSHYPTCMIFGVGLGYALTQLLEKHTFDYIFICEPDFETFYASLYCTDWQAILNKADVESGCIFLHIGTPYESFFDELQKVYEDIGAFSLISSFCYQHTPLPEVSALVRAFFERFYQLQLGYGFYNDAVTGLAHTVENFNRNQCPLFVPPSKHSPYRDLTAYVVANGPSVDEAVEALKENQDNVVIFAAGTAINTLLNLGIQPDFHVLVERPLSTYEVQLETLSIEDMKSLNLLAVDVIYPELPPYYKWAALGLKGPEAGSLLSQYEYLKQSHKLLTTLPNAGPLVANTALSFASKMGFGEIYLIGVDNGYPDHGPSHSSYSIYSDGRFNKEYRVNTDVPYKLDGNLGGTVKATNLMVSAKQQMERLVKDTPKTQYYNVGSGAKIDGAQALCGEDILPAYPLKSKATIVEDIKQRLFQPFSINATNETIGIKEFEELCDYLNEIAERPFTSRKEASDILKAQSRVVYAYRGRKYGHLFHIIKGTMLYVHCPLMSLLYLYDDQEKTLVWFKQSLEIWKKCIKLMKQDYRQAWNKRCDLSLEMVRHQRWLDEQAEANKQSVKT